MDNLQIFNNPKFGKIRGMLIDGEPWFVGKDAARALGYANPRDALAKHVPKKYKKDGVAIRDSMGRLQSPTFISEPGLYRLIFRSALPAAEEMFDWVCEEVMPSLRKTGSYTMPNADKMPGAPFAFERGIEIRRLASHTRDPLLREKLVRQAANLLAGEHIVAEIETVYDYEPFFTRK